MSHASISNITYNIRSICQGCDELAFFYPLENGTTCSSRSHLGHKEVFHHGCANPLDFAVGNCRAAANVVEQVAFRWGGMTEHHCNCDMDVMDSELQKVRRKKKQIEVKKCGNGGSTMCQHVQCHSQRRTT